MALALVLMVGGCESSELDPNRLWDGSGDESDPLVGWDTSGESWNSEEAACRLACDARLALTERDSGWTCASLLEGSGEEASDGDAAPDDAPDDAGSGDGSAEASGDGQEEGSGYLVERDDCQRRCLAQSRAYAALGGTDECQQAYLWREACLGEDTSGERVRALLCGPELAAAGVEFENVCGLFDDAYRNACGGPISYPAQEICNNGVDDDGDTQVDCDDCDCRDSGSCIWSNACGEGSAADDADAADADAADTDAADADAGADTQSDTADVDAAAEGDAGMDSQDDTSTDAAGDDAGDANQGDEQ